ncbi:MAG: hypothetical protein R3F59_33835 [Myxococcota bacterium]
MDRSGVRRLVLGGAWVGAIAIGLGLVAASSWLEVAAVAAGVVGAAFLGAWIRCGSEAPAVAAPVEVSAAPAPPLEALVRHAASAVGLGHAEVSPEGRIGRVTAPLGAMLARWGTPDAWWGEVQRAGGLPTASVCGRCLRPEWRGARIVELVEPVVAGEGGARRVFEVTAAGHPADCADGASVLQVADVAPRVDRELLLAASRDEAVDARRALQAELAQEVEALEAAMGEPEALRAAARRVAALVGSLRDDAVQPPRLAERTFGVAALVHDLQPQAARLAEADGNRLSLRIRGDLGVVLSDPARVRQVG